jgi:hypothetical protein
MFNISSFLLFLPHVISNEPAGGGWWRDEKSSTPFFTICITRCMAYKVSLSPLRSGPPGSIEMTIFDMIAKLPLRLL